MTGDRLPVERLGSYRLLEKLGAGGMGEVFLAENTLTGVKAAVKILPGGSAATPEARDRFVREATEASRVQHPGVVRALTAGEENGIFYYVMDYCEGATLAHRLETSGPLPVAEAIDLVAQISEGLDHIHRSGLVHRDVKPENVLITPEGKAKILDLGLVKNLQAPAGDRRTAAGDSLGTPATMSPEQARGDASIDGRADLYSLGATFFHMVTGRPPFAGGSPFEIVSRHLTEAAPDPRDLRTDLPERAARAIRRLLSKKPGDRYATGAELAADLRGEAPPPRRLPVLALGAAALVAAAVALAAFSNGRPDPAPAAPSRLPPIDLLKLVDLKRHSLGEWRLKDGALISGTGGHNQLPHRVGFQCRIPEEYDLDVVAERVEGTETFLVTLVAGGRPICVFLDGYLGNSCGVSFDGDWLQVSGPVLAGGPKRIQVSVRKDAVEVAIDGKRLLRRADLERLEAPAYAHLNTADMPVVLGTIRSSFRITRADLTPIAP